MQDMIQALQSVLDASVESGAECGCQLTVYRHGELICDLCAGFTETSHSQKVSQNTLFPIFSVGKGILTTLAHICAEKGFIDYNAPVIQYWPEFGVNGKAETKVRHLLTHRAGLYDFPSEFPFYDRFNWEKACVCMENMAPLDKIGGIHHYHAYTFGLIVGRLLEKASGRPVNDLLKEYILTPLGITDFFYGVPDARLNDIAPIIPDRDLADERLKFNSPLVLQGINPSSNGTANAHAIARVYASLIGDGIDGIKLLKDETLKNALILQRSAEDTVCKDQWDKFGLGYALIGPEAPWNRTFGHGGACGSEGMADRETGYAIGFTKNKLNATHPVHPVRDEISKILGIPKRVW